MKVLFLKVSQQTQKKKFLKLPQKRTLSLCDFNILSNNCNIFDIDQINSSLKTGIVDTSKKKIDFEQFTIDFVKQL
jgi:hypothetical protein